MQTISIGKDLHILSGSALHAFHRKLPDGSVQFEHCDTGAFLTFKSTADFVDALAKDRINLYKPEQSKPLPVLEKLKLPMGERDFGSLPKAKKEAAERRHGYVRAAVNSQAVAYPRKAREILEIPETPDPKDQSDDERAASEAKKKRRRKETDRNLRDVIATHARLIGDKNPPSVSSVREWVRKCQAEGFSVKALVDNIKGRAVGLGAELEGLMEKAIQEVYLTRQQPSKVKAFHMLLAMIEDENRERRRKKEIELKSPGRRTFERRIDAIPAYVRVLRRRGADEARRRFRAQTRPKPYVTRILEVVEIDHTQLDVIVYDDDLQVALGRPWLTAARDRLTGMCVGFYVTITKPSQASVFACIAHMAMPKTYVADRYPFVNGIWPCWGLPEMVVLDNGLEFHAEDVKTALAQLNCDVSYHATRSPWIKGLIERFMKAMGEDLIQMIPGTTFGSIKKRGDYKSQKYARARFSTLIALIHKWIIDVHSKGTSDLFYKPRVEAWNAAAVAHEPFLPDDFEELRRILSERETRVLSHKGVVLYNLPYGSTELNAIREVRGRGPNDTVDVTVLFDRRDLGSVYVIVPNMGEAIKVPCLYPSYATGISLEMHKIVMKRARAKYKNVETELAISMAQAEIMLAIRDEMRDRRIAQRTKLASRANINSEATNANAARSVSTLVLPQGVTIPALNRAGELRPQRPFSSEIL